MLDLNICTFKELIESAFGDSENNAVNFKAIQTILYLLARQMGVLDRLVQIDLVSEHSSATVSSITVSEIKIKPASATKKIKSKNVYEKGKEIRRTEEILEEKNIFKNQTLARGDKNIQTQPLDFKRDFIIQGWPYNPSLDDIETENNVYSWKTLPISTMKTVSNGPRVNEKLSEHKFSTASSGGVFNKLKRDKYTKPQSVLNTETLSKKEKKYDIHSVIQDLFHQRSSAQESISEEENHQEYQNTRHDYILSSCIREEKLSEKIDLNKNATSMITQDKQIDKNENLYQKEEYRRKDVQNLYTVITVTKNLEKTIQRSSKQCLIFKDGSVNDIMLPDSNSLGQKYFGEPHPSDSATMGLRKKTSEPSISKFYKQRQALFSKTPGYGAENFDFKREKTSNNDEKTRTNQLNDKHTLSHIFLTYVDSLGEIVSLGEINEVIPKKDYDNLKYTKRQQLYPFSSEETNRDGKESIIGESERLAEPLKRQPTDYVESHEITKYQDHQKIKSSHRSSSENMILTGYEDGNLILGYENETKATCHSENRGRKNSKYEQFYGSSTEELISKFEEIFRGPKQIRSQSEPSKTVQTFGDKPHFQTSQEIIFKRDITQEISSEENRNEIDKEYKKSNFTHEKTQFQSHSGEKSSEENRNVKDQNYLEPGSTKKISDFPREKQRFQSHSVEVSLEGTPNGKDKNFSALVKTKKKSTYPYETQFQSHSDEISLEENRNGIFLDPVSTEKTSAFPRGKTQFPSHSGENNLDDDRSVQAGLLAAPTDWSFITENANSKYKEMRQAIMSKSFIYQREDINPISKALSVDDIDKYIAMKDSILSKTRCHDNIHPKMRSRSSSGTFDLTKQILGYDEQGIADNGPFDIRRIINKRNLTPLKLRTSAQKENIERVKNREKDDIKYESDNRKRQKDRIYDSDNFGVRNFIGDLNDIPKSTDPSDVETEKTRLSKPMLKEERKVYTIVMQDDSEELKLKYQRQRDAIFAKCGGYTQEAIVPKDDLLLKKDERPKKKAKRVKRKKRKHKSGSSKELIKQEKQRDEFLKEKRQDSDYETESYSSEESVEVTEKNIGSLGKPKKRRRRYKTKIDSDGKLKSGRKRRKKDKYEDSEDSEDVSSESEEYGYKLSVKKEKEIYSSDDTINQKRTKDKLKQRKKEIKSDNDKASRDIVERNEDNLSTEPKGGEDKYLPADKKKVTQLDEDKHKREYDKINKETAKKKGKKGKHDSEDLIICESEEQSYDKTLSDESQKIINKEKKEKDADNRYREKDGVKEDINNLKKDLLKSGIDSVRQEQIEEYPYSKEDGIKSGYLPETDQKDANNKKGGELDKSEDFGDSDHLKSPYALMDSNKSKDTETNKDADGKKDGTKIKGMGPTSPELDKPKNADQLKDSKKLKDSAKLQDTDKLSDSKKYDDPSKSKKVKQQTAAISDGTESEYVKHTASEDLLASAGPMGTKGGKKLDIHGVPLEVFEELREQELRVINQRADSREEPDREPTRMLSVPAAEKALAHSTKEGQKVKAGTKGAPGKLSKRTSSTDSRRTSQDIEEEKILVVERIPLDKEKAREYKEKHKDTPLAIVKLEEFQELAKEVKELEARMRPASKYSLPGNAELLELIRNGSSLTEAMAALQLSARIEAAEGALENIIEMVSKLAAQNPDIDIDLQGQPIVTKSAKRDEIPTADLVVGGAKCREGCVTKPQFDDELLRVQREFAKEISESAKKNLGKIDALAKSLKGLESRVEDAVQMTNRINDLEESVSSYSERINAMDTGLSVQMTSYQDQLTQMQHELEEGLENMAETLANSEGDPAAVSELHAKFNILQEDLINTTNIQSELEKNEHDVFVNLKDIFIQLEHLRETKADREEVEDALQNKAGLSALNGLISLEHFDALIGDVENHIESAYDKFNNQELIWQKAINDLVKELNEKTNLEIVISLRDDINKKLNMLMDKINSLREIVGEPKAFSVSKRINVGTECLSCKTPAQMEPEDKPTRLPPLKSSLAAVGEDFMKEAGDACYPGLPIPHPFDPRSHICNRYCGGSHTMVKNVIHAKSVTGALTLTKIDKPIKTAEGTDGKAYLVGDPGVKIPCAPCNIAPSVSAIDLGRKPSAPVKGRAVFNIEVRESDKCPCCDAETPPLDSNLTLT